MIKDEVFTTGAGSKIKYKSYAEPHEELRRCCQTIPEGEFRHKEKEHRCDVKHDHHTCRDKCTAWFVLYQPKHDICFHHFFIFFLSYSGYYCELEFGHTTPHDCAHGNMRNTKFYATEGTLF